MAVTIDGQRLVRVLNDRDLWKIRNKVCSDSLGREVADVDALGGDDARKVANDLNSDGSWGWADFKNKQHMRILSVCYQLGKTVYNEKLRRDVADVEWLGRWLKYYSAPKKKLKLCDQLELGQIIMAMELMLNNRMK